MTTSVGPFVPWGWMPKPFQEAMPIPEHPRFRPSGGWVPWLETTADELKTFIWPRWSGTAWDGDLGLAEALTRADLVIMGPLAALLAQPVGPGGPTHGKLFVDEDRGRPGLTGFLGYLPVPPPQVAAEFDRLLGEGGQLGEGAAIELKQRMQRPRPYQTAFLLEPATTFDYLVANTAVTPSLVSGHALQGAIALVNVVVRLEHLQGRPLDPQVLTEMQRFFIHIGDRRVMAGVHYPTDNASSWYTVLRLCRQLVFDRPDDPAYTDMQRARGRAVLWQAIIEHSPVWSAMVAHADKAPAIRAVLSRLRSEATE